MERYTYKAKTLGDGEWVYGSYICGDGYDFSSAIIGGSLDKRVSGEIEIDPETLCQCTGLKDKGGNLVFEGDILQAHSDGIKVCVVWEEKEGGFKCEIIRKTNKFAYRFMSVDNASLLKVIGNKFDTPELLGG